MKRFFALSRTTHGVLDIAGPGFYALLWLGAFPHWSVILLSLFTAFAAYTAIYALNDLVGMAGDKERFNGGINPGYSVEASELRYPLAQNALSFRSGLAWFAIWYLAALVGSYLLNPVIVIILLIVTVLEIIYCKLFKVTYYRTLISGFVKSSGPISAIFVVNPNPDPWLLLLALSWFYFWEIGGQNIPADWNDTEEDRRVGAKTIPLQLGTNVAGTISLLALCATVIISAFLPLISPLSLGWPYILISLLAGFFLLLRPGYELFKSHEGRKAAKLFDHASYYPLAHLAIIAVFVLISYIHA